MMDLEKPKLHTKFEVAASAVAKILKETPKFWAAPLAHGQAYFLVWLYDGPWQTQAAYQIWSRKLQPLKKY